MKLYDALLEHPRLVAGENTSLKVHESMRYLLKEATRYRVNEIAQYFWEHADTDPEKDAWSLHNPDYFPSLKPPGRIAWMEYDMPKRVRVGDNPKLRQNPHYGNLVGGLMNVLDRDNPQFVRHFQNKEIPDSAYWLVQLHTYIMNRHDAIFQIGQCVSAITGDGDLSIESSGMPSSYVYTMHDALGPGIPEDTVVAVASTFIKPFFLACSFLAADNVEVVERAPKPSIPGRKPKKQFTSYNVINVYPAKRRYTSSDKTSKSSGGSRKPFIGHWRRYGYAGRGLLFGKHKCILYIEGKADDKDREVHLPD